LQRGDLPFAPPPVCPPRLPARCPSPERGVRPWRTAPELLRRAVLERVARRTRAPLRDHVRNLAPLSRLLAPVPADYLSSMATSPHGQVDRKPAVSTTCPV